MSHNHIKLAKFPFHLDPNAKFMQNKLTYFLGYNAFCCSGDRLSKNKAKNSLIGRQLRKLPI
jgi:hypothetical protein